MSKKPAASASASLTGHGTPANTAPVASNDAYVVAEGGTLNIPGPGVLGNDVDPDGDPITAILVSGPANASSFVFNADGSFNYVHNGSETTSDSFTYQVSDGAFSSNIAQVFIAVVPVNDAPVAFNDGPYAVAEDNSLTVAAPGVLGNDIDPDSPFTAILVTGPVFATSFALNADGSFSYTPAPNFNGADSFTYKANDGTLDSNVTTVTIFVTAVNDPPIANIDFLDIFESDSSRVFDLLANDTDVDLDPLTVVACSDLVINTSHVDGDVAAKLPNLTVTPIDLDPTNGSPCQWTISTDNGVATLTLPASGQLFYLVPGGPPFSGLDPASADLLILTGTYTITDGNGGSASQLFVVNVFGQ
jgi:hypothetical protein